MMYWYGGYSGGWESEFLTRVGGGRLKEMKDEDQKEQSFYSLTVAPSHMDHLHSFFLSSICILGAAGDLGRVQ